MFGLKHPHKSHKKHYCKICLRLHGRTIFKCEAQCWSSMNRTVMTLYQSQFSPPTCRMSFDGITMTKLSGKKPRRPFSSPSHQPSSSVSWTARLNRHISRQVLWDVQIMHRRLTDGQERCVRHAYFIFCFSFFRYFGIPIDVPHDLRNCHIKVI